MPKLSYEEFKQKYSEKIDESILDELLEDTSDSFAVVDAGESEETIALKAEKEALEAEVAGLKAEVEVLKDKYRSRFFGEAVEEKVEEAIEEPSEAEVVDIKDI